MSLLKQRIASELPLSMLETKPQIFHGPQYRPLIDDITLKHGPREKLGSIILQGYAECMKAGVALSFAPIETLVDLNIRHRDSWSPLLGVFDHRLGQLGPHNTYCVVGRNPHGDIVYTRAARLYELGASCNFASLTESNCHIYGGSEHALEGESWTVSGEASTTMAAISGRVSFSGAVWCHPSYRKRRFTRIASHLGRALSWGLWDSDYTVTFMAARVVTGGHAKNTGYSNVSWTVHARGASIGDMDIAFLWMDRSETLARMDDALAGSSSEINKGVING